ncbi:MAG: DNA-directed RNA polymerase subunit H [Candidatus Woesearchaeota archaeon]
MKTIKHVLVPEHIKLSEAEKKELLEKYKISLNELPRILKNDPAIAHLNVKEGDVIKIIRKSESAGESIYYRVVVNE